MLIFAEVLNHLYEDDILTGSERTDLLTEYGDCVEGKKWGPGGFVLGMRVG